MPTPPITRYKDEPVDQTTEDLVNQELEKEAATVKTVEPEAKEELKVLPVSKTEKKTNSANIVNAFRQKMSVTATPIDLPSVGKTVEFKEISTAEQKELSKIALESDSRADIMYCSMISLINKLAMEKKFDIRDYTEFERIAITLNLQQMSKINPEIKFTCSKCGRENSYTLDTAKLLREFAKTYKPDEELTIDAGNRKFVFVSGWPCVRNVEEFFKHYYRKYDNSSKSIKESMNNMSQIEYITMFLKKVTVESISDPDDKLTANLEELTYSDRAQIIDCLPQNVLFDDKTGAITLTIESFVNPLNDVFKYHDCSYCGAEQSGQVAALSDFLGG